MIHPDTTIAGAAAVPHLSDELDWSALDAAGLPWFDDETGAVGFVLPNGRVMLAERPRILSADASARTLARHATRTARFRAMLGRRQAVPSMFREPPPDPAPATSFPTPGSSTEMDWSVKVAGRKVVDLTAAQS
jgi:hypothetical protein